LVACDQAPEKALIVQLCKLTDVLELFCDTLMPHHLCAYLYELAGAITTFTRDCRVLGSPMEDRRILLCEASAVTMRTCLNLLGIEAPLRL
jgi:arginyl-tRNA synthetase